MTLRETFVRAAEALFRAHGTMPAGQERPWGKLLREQIIRDHCVADATDDYRHPELSWPHWTRRPGPIDLVWRVGSGGRGAVELKIRKPDELAWDLVKLAEHTVPVGAGAFQFCGICVQVNPSDLQRGTGALLSSSHVGVQRPLHWIERWPGDWLHLMCGGRGIRPTSLPSLVELHPPIVIGNHEVAHWTITPISHPATAVSHARDDLDEWGWPSSIGPRPAGWAAKVKASDDYAAKTGPQRMIDCAGYDMPARFRPGQADPWMAQHVPRMTNDQRTELTRILQQRRWTREEILRHMSGSC